MASAVYVCDSRCLYSLEKNNGCGGKKKKDKIKKTLLPLIPPLSAEPSSNLSNLLNTFQANTTSLSSPDMRADSRSVNVTHSAAAQNPNQYYAPPPAAQPAPQMLHSQLPKPVHHNDVAIAPAMPTPTPTPTPMPEFESSFPGQIPGIGQAASLNGFIPGIGMASLQPSSSSSPSSSPQAPFSKDAGEGLVNNRGHSSLGTNDIQAMHKAQLEAAKAPEHFSPHIEAKPQEAMLKQAGAGAGEQAQAGNSTHPLVVAGEAMDGASSKMRSPVIEIQVCMEMGSV